MVKGKRILAKKKGCNNDGCRNKGHIWINLDPDTIPFVLCKKHLADFEMKLLEASQTLKGENK